MRFFHFRMIPIETRGAYAKIPVADARSLEIVPQQHRKV